MSELWVRLEPTRHALQRAEKRNIVIPEKINLLDPELRFSHKIMWEKDSYKLIVYIPLKREDGTIFYYKRVPILINNGFQQSLKVKVKSIHLREATRIRKAINFRDIVKFVLDNSI